MSTPAYPDPVSQSVSNLVTDCHKSWLDAVCAVMTTPLTSRRSCRPRHSKTIQLTVLPGASGQVRRRAVLARRHTDMVGCGVVRDGCPDSVCGLRHGRQAAGAWR